MTVLVAALVGFSQAIVGAGSLASATRESAMANEAARSILEELRAMPIDEVFLRYNDEVADDVGFCPGSNFAVPGLDPDAADPDGFAGRILFPVDANAPGVLYEDMPDDAGDRSFGLPLDLSGEGDIDQLDHALDYEMLPVVVRIEWRSGKLEVRTILTDMH